MDKKNGEHWSVLSPTMDNTLRSMAGGVLKNLKNMTTKKYKKPCSISVNTYLWSEALESARQSINFHKDTNTPSLYKELGHICFWFSKLKPIGLDNPGEKREKEIALFPINEIFAIAFCLKIISDMENHLLETIMLVKTGEITEEEALQMGLQHSDWKDVTQQSVDERKSRIKDSVERTQAKLNSLTHSLRYHNYSARAMATAFEWAFAGADSFSQLKAN